MTEVVDLSTGEVVAHYLLPPHKAVVCAFYQYELRDYNTWDYDWTKARFSPSGKTVTCGNYSALVPHAPEVKLHDED